MGSLICKLLSKGKQPIIEGEFFLEGIKNEVFIRRDKFGMVHIEGNFSEDVFFAQGFVHAQERLWQMEIVRRVSLGTLSELIGEEALVVDRISRTFGFARIGKLDEQKLDPKFKKMLEVYVKGVNAFLHHPKLFKMPIEMTIARFKKPRDFTISDLCAFSRLVTWQLCYGWYTPLIKMLVLETLKKKNVPEEAAKELDIDYSDFIPFIIPLGEKLNWDELEKIQNDTYLKHNSGSNAWSVSGEHTVSGKPLMCSDPHLEPSLPGFWFANHIKVSPKDGEDEPYDEAIGATLPGFLGVILGHNGTISWGIALSFVASSDIFIEKLKEENGKLKAEFQGVYEDVEVIEEEIKIKKKPSHIEKVVITRHGPVISGILKHEESIRSDSTDETKDFQLSLSVQATFLESSDFLGYLFRCSYSKNFKEMKQCLHNMHGPHLSVCYADIHGNIGYILTGKIPIRENGGGDYPREGFSGKHEWQGYIPADKMPFCLNPPEGIILACNNQIVDYEKYPYNLGKMFLSGSRAARLKQIFEEKIKEKGKLDVDDMKDMQLDTTTIYASQFIKLAESVSEVEDEDIMFAIKELKSWDGNLKPESRAAAIYELFKNILPSVLLEDTLGAKLTKKVVGEGYSKELKHVSGWTSNITNIILKMLDNEESWFVKNAGGRKHVIQISLKKALQFLKKNLGNRSKWNWGSLHAITFPHGLGTVLSTFNRGPYPVGGDEDTPCNFAHSTSFPHKPTYIHPSWRQINDHSDLASKTVFIMPSGNSGILGNPHYDDCITKYLHGKYNRLLWNPEDIKKQTEGILRFKKPLIASNNQEFLNRDESHVN